MRKRRQIKKNIPVALTTKVTEATLEGSKGGSICEFDPEGPAPLLGGGDGVGLGKSEGIAGIAGSNTT